MRLAAHTVAATKHYGSGDATVVAIDQVSVRFQAGAFHAIMGPSGSGKSTLLHCMAGLDQVTSGQAFLGDVELSRLDDAHLTKVRREQVGFIFQSFNLVPTLTAGENIELPALIAGRAPDRPWIDYLVDRLGIRDRLAHRPAQLSGGQQQRVAAVRALAHHPKVVFADEPTGNLDTRAGGELLQLLTSVTREIGQTVVMVTHDPLAAAHTDSVTFLVDGHSVDQVVSPTPEQVLDRMKELDQTSLAKD